jgi:hypothetical protein
LADERDVGINMHIGSLLKPSFRLRVIPVVGSRKEPVNPEMLRETPPELVETLHVTVRPVYAGVTMAEVDV